MNNVVLVNLICHYGADDFDITYYTGEAVVKETLVHYDLTINELVRDGYTIKTEAYFEGSYSIWFEKRL